MWCGKWRVGWGINAAKARSKCKEPAVAANGGEMTPKNDPGATSCSLTLTFYLRQELLALSDTTAGPKQ